jgi:hypothetical protein
MGTVALGMPATPATVFDCIRVLWGHRRAGIIFGVWCMSCGWDVWVQLVVEGFTNGTWWWVVGLKLGRGRMR